MTIIATRIYPIDDIRTGIEYEARDTMVRNVDGGFTLKRATNGHPGEPDSESSYCLADVHEWLRDMPWQIRRAVY